MPGRFARIPVRAAAVRGFTVTTYRVLIAISSFADGATDIADVGNTSIAKEAGIRRDKVPAEAARIVQAGLLEVVGKGEHGRRRYRLVLDDDCSLIREPPAKEPSAREPSAKGATAPWSGSQPLPSQGARTESLQNPDQKTPRSPPLDLLAERVEVVEPQPVDGEILEPDKGKTDGRKRAMASGWRPNSGHWELANALGLDCEYEADDFREWTSAKAFRYADWDRAFNQHLKRKADDRKRGRSGGGRQGGSQIAAALDLVKVG